MPQCSALSTRHLNGARTGARTRGQTIGIKINYEPLAEAQKALQTTVWPGASSKGLLMPILLPMPMPIHSRAHSTSVAHKSSGRLLRRLQALPVYIYIYIAAPRFPSCSRIKYLFSKILMEPKKLSVQMPSNTQQQVNQPACQPDVSFVGVVRVRVCVGVFVFYVADSWKQHRAEQSRADKFISFVRKLNACLTYLNF